MEGTEMRVRFKINDEAFFNNGKVILKALPQIEKNFRESFHKEGEVEITERKNGHIGVTATSLNKTLRRCLEEYPINGETHVEYGVFFHNKKEGFDFSIYDKEYNLSRLYNYYQGSVGILGGDKKILEEYKRIGYKRKSDWRGKIEEIQSKVKKNSDYIIEKEKLTVAGELQFGNWALIYRDLFRLLDADNNPGIDLYIYVTASEKLSNLLSDNTVSYKQAQNVISEYLSVIKTPIWLIGLDIKKI